MVSPQVVFLQEYKGGGGGVCIEYKQGTVENWLPIAANECVCVCVYVGGAGCGQFSQFIILKNQNPLTPPPHPPSPPSRWWIMTSPHLAIYSYIFFILLFYLFIYSFLITFIFTKGEYQKELFYLTYLGSVPINLCLAFIWMRFGILLYREVRKKWFPSGRSVSHLWGTRRTAV